MLAITFTNKAVAEMKQRILDYLGDFANADQNVENALFADVAKELGLSPFELQQRSKTVLKLLLHNYAFFDISTIDAFNHRLIRTFARDLQISQNFDVALDVDTLLRQAISNVIEKAGHDEELTKVLIDFSLEKIEQDKSWDISYNLFETGKLIFNENQYAHIDNLKSKSITDFFELKKGLQKQILDAVRIISTSAEECLDLLSANGLKFTDFTGGYFPKFLEKAFANPDKLEFEKAKWKQNFGEGVLYNKKTPESAKAAIDGLMPTFEKYFNNIKTSFFKSELLKRCKKKLVPLALLSEITKALNELKEELGVLTISEFNQLISKEIKKQPIPFIYERLGERYQHYFIDEFQDTSQLQWDNLVPLISHALESQDEKGEPGTLFIVGDVKQSIYRWRGGEAQQFLNLVLQNKNPFQIAPVIEQLPKNWRSHKKIVDFNNGFFSFIAKKLSNKDYERIYLDGNQQLPNSQQGGIVSINFVDKDPADGVCPHCLKTSQIVTSILNNGYALGDICVLVRSKKESALVAEFLQEKGFEIIANEGLLLRNCEEVQFIISFVHSLINQENKEYVLGILEFLEPDLDAKHNYFIKNLNDFPKYLDEEFGLDFYALKKEPLLNCVQRLISTFRLHKKGGAFINAFVDVIFEFEQNLKGTFSEFIDHWYLNEDSFAITSAENRNALRIMTIHKAKGLEFKFVVYPFADSVINDSRKADELWFSVNPEDNFGFNELLVTQNKYMEFYSENSKAAFLVENEKSELDDFNVLYVALTRAVLGLYIISTNTTMSSSSKSYSYSSLFYEYLTEQCGYNRDSQEFVFGKLPSNNVVQEETGSKIILKYSIADFKENPAEIAMSQKYTNTEATKSIRFGNIVHKALAKIYTFEDIEPIANELLNHDEIAIEELESIKKTLSMVIKHKSLNSFYGEGVDSRNEIDILQEDGSLLRPDKIVLKNGSATLIDYKTGEALPAHREQVNIYANCLEKMGYKVDQKLLVYINDKINTVAV